ncbi:MAG: AAA family ATPase, partial [Clostridia bacterium]
MKSGYINRIIDDVIKRELMITGGVVIKGPKWCGKTTTAKEFAQSVLDLQSMETMERYKKVAENSVMLLLEGDKPKLIDEWQEIPMIWNAVRTDIDEKNEPGLYILTGSTTPKDEKGLHSGIGRLAFVEMKPMTLYESGDSNGTISLKDIVDNKIKVYGQKSNMDYQRLAFLTCRGGWPSAINKADDIALDVAKEYVKALTESDISKVDNKMRNSKLTRHILSTYARHVSTIDSNKILFDDIKYNYGIVTEATLYDYINILKRLYVIHEIDAWN